VALKYRPQIGGVARPELFEMAVTAHKGDNVWTSRRSRVNRLTDWLASLLIDVMAH